MSAIRSFHKRSKQEKQTRKIEKNSFQSIYSSEYSYISRVSTNLAFINGNFGKIVSQNSFSIE